MATRYTYNSSVYGHRIPSVYRQARRKSGLEKVFDRITDFLVAYWAHIVTIVFGTLVLCAIAIPFLSYLGLDSIAKPIFFALHMVCAQIPAHSFYVLGHQLGLCARNFSIYTAMFIGSLIFVLTKKRIKGIPWWLWILMTAPIALDGTTQMVGLRESDWILRVVTGTLFGAGNIWYALPMMQKSLTETVVPPIPPALLKNDQDTDLASTVSATTIMPTPSTTPTETYEDVPSHTQVGYVETKSILDRVDADTQIQRIETK